MKHAMIAPTAYLSLIPSEFRSLHLVLAHLLPNKKYADYYRNEKNKGAVVIVDNGAFEFKKPLPLKQLASLINNANLVPDYVVAPDFPYEDWKKTYKSTEYFSRYYGDYFDATRTSIMAVPQSIVGDWKGWLNCYRELDHLPGVKMLGMSILGIPNAFCSLTGTSDISFNRTFATNYILKNDLKARSKHHYLGCGDPRELLFMNQLGLADSNDSSTVFWHAINDIRFDESASGLELGKLQKEVDFNHPLDSSKIENINYNINWVKGILGLD